MSSVGGYSESGGELRRVPLKDIVPDDRYQVRKKLDRRRYKQYRDSYAEGKDLGRLLCIQISGVLFLIDGFHRYHALKDTPGRSEVDVEVHVGTHTDALRLMGSVNLEHGKSLTRPEKWESFDCWIAGGGHIKRRTKDRKVVVKSAGEIAKERGGMTKATVLNWLRKRHRDLYERCYAKEDRDKWVPDMAGEGRGKQPRRRVRHGKLALDRLQDARALLNSAQQNILNKNASLDELEGIKRELRQADAAVNEILQEQYKNYAEHEGLETPPFPPEWEDDEEQDF